jgi:hypothetical protein
VRKLVHDPQPELRALVLLKPEAEDFLAAIGFYAERDMDGLVAHETLIPDLHPQGVEEDDRIDRLERPRLPGGDLLEHGVRHRTDQVRRDVDAVEIVQMPDDLAGAHPSGIHGNDLLVETGEPPLVLRDQLRIEVRLPVARDVERQLAGVRRHRLAAVAVAAIAGLAGFEMVVHLRVQSPLGERLLQLIEQAVGVECGLRVGTGQKLVEQPVRDSRGLASGHGGSPSFPLCPPAHEIPDSPVPHGTLQIRSPP